MTKKHAGFTIVELITVIAVLGVLISIVTISVGNWRKETAENEVKSNLTNAASAMENARNFSNGYPGALPSSFTESKHVKVELKSSTSSTYCIEGSSREETTVVFKITHSATSPVSGGC